MDQHYILLINHKATIAVFLYMDLWEGLPYGARKGNILLTNILLDFKRNLFVFCEIFPYYLKYVYMFAKYILVNEIYV